MQRRFARQVDIDHIDHTVTIDGVPIPWWLTKDGPVIEPPTDDLPLSVVSLPIWVDGLVRIRTDEGLSFVDPVIGDVGQWARDFVRESLLDLFPDLVIP